MNSRPSSQSETWWLLAYVPVIHQGYLKMIAELVDEAEQAGATLKIGLLGQTVRELVPALRKDIRALPDEAMQAGLAAALQSLVLPHQPAVTVITVEQLASFSSPTKVFMPDEDLSHQVVTKWLGRHSVVLLPTSLRWDSQAALKPQEVTPDEVVSQDELDQRLMLKAEQASAKSVDWWRQVGAVLVKDGQVLLEASNQHVPSPIEPYYQGDPRGNFHKGQHIELSTALHAEASLIAQAAHQGLSVAGCDVYVSTFPCPSCAKLLAHTGLKRIFYRQGYAMIDGAEILKAKGITLTRVK